jgi:hypothetical protein
MDDVDVCYAFRRDFPRLDKPLPDSEIRQGSLYSGTDLFAFRVSWWHKNRDSVPDMLIGTEYWDWVMRMVIDRSEPDKSVSFIDLIYHERHGTYWEHPDNRGTCSSQMHNRQKVIEFRQKHGIHDDGLTSREFKITKI